MAGFKDKLVSCNLRKRLFWTSNNSN